MIKELTPLEALKDLLNNQYYIALCRVQGKKQLNNDIRIIETTLKKYEKILNVIPQEIRSIDELQSMANWFYNNDYKKLKALEIIKEKEVNVFIFLHSGDLETYNDMVEDNRKLTQEQFDLLKEVLLCE